MIEIAERVTCPRCNGTGTFGVNNNRCNRSDCKDGTVPRVLATFADAAALRTRIGDTFSPAHESHKQAWEDFLTGEQIEAMATAVLAALGVTDDQR